MAELLRQTQNSYWFLVVIILFVLVQLAQLRKTWLEGTKAKLEIEERQVIKEATESAWRDYIVLAMLIVMLFWLSWGDEPVDRMFIAEAVLITIAFVLGVFVIILQRSSQAFDRSFNLALPALFEETRKRKHED